MAIFCLPEFQKEFRRLSRNRSYKDLEQVLIEYFFAEKDFSSGIRLNGSFSTPYIKKRLKGRGGYRCYYLFLVKDGNVYLMFVHPKTGSKAMSTISNSKRSQLYKDVLEAIKNNTLLEVKLDPLNQSLDFVPVPVREAVLH